MRTMIIYDYYNGKTEIGLPDKEIKKILVEVYSGDETGIVYFADNSQMAFESSQTRYLSYYDGSYIVPKDRVEEWLNYTNAKDIVSYARMETFGGSKDVRSV